MSLHDVEHLSSEEIAARLKNERADLAQNIDKLRESVTTDQLFGQAMDYAKSNIGPYARAIDGVVRSNPMATAMVGVGLAWLVFGRKTRKPQERPLAGTRFEALSRWEDEGGPVVDDPSDDERWIKESDALRDRAARALARLDAAARRNLVPASEIAQEHARVLADLAKSLRATMGQGLETLSAEARDRLIALREEAYAARIAAVQQSSRLIEERPLVAGAIGMAIGAAVGSVLPGSAVEDRLFGQERDRLLSLADEMLQHERQRVARAAGDLADTVAEEVKGTARQLVTEAL